MAKQWNDEADGADHPPARDQIWVRLFVCIALRLEGDPPRAITDADDAVGCQLLAAGPMGDNVALP